ncbi:EthD domain-containing protein [Chitinophaga nivalis]|uniref:EthD domain-containing protein n=1 Tax=Chitinophaga nivalis TaxID=2991709 RepID=A0ABT3IH00_9BACT|nr:EthD domain-containing protein [Chitinophaga nivalis]MCW3467065.1 EthD domain-containing protein [Chitinophaga nivalis]MCW3483244.1 EthD domain-containing protein [Chitinophaga nivalis]
MHTPTTTMFLDNRIKTLSITPLKKRKNISRTQFQQYWKDIHGPVCARLPHLGIYVQHHMHPSNPDLFPVIAGVDNLVSPENAWDGFAEIGFFSDADLQQWLPTTAILFDDEQNVFDTTVAYYGDNNSATHKDIRESLITNGNDGRKFFYLFIHPKTTVTLDAADHFFRDAFLPAFQQHPAISRLRYHMLAPHDNTTPQPPAPNVQHYLASEHQHRYVIELAAADLLELKSVYASPAFQQLLPGIAQHFSHIHPFESADRYTMAYNGQITNIGLRGATNAALITAIGAENQIREDVRSLLLTGSYHHA